MNRPPQVCHFYSKGNCIKGTSCPFVHQKQDQNGNGQQQKPLNNHYAPKNYHSKGDFNQNKPKSKNCCKFFVTQKGCNQGDKCNFMHNYHETLHHIKREIIHSDPIVGCCSTGKLIN